MYKKDSPNHFTGGIAGRFMLERLRAKQAAAATPVAPIAPVAPTADVSAGAAISGGTMDPTNPFAGKTFQITPANMVDPSLASVGIDASETFQPPMAGNEIGGKKPVFDMNTKGMAETIYGSAMQRQVSVNSPYKMKSIPEGDKGAGLRALPDNVVENMGYDAATKMVSPLGMHHKYKAPEVDPYFRNPGGNANITKTLTKKPKETTGLRRAASVLTGGLSEVAAEVAQRVKNYNNPPQQNFTKVKTEMPKKRANGGHRGYVVSTTTGERIPTETIPQQTFTQAQNILKRQPQNILKKK